MAKNEITLTLKKEWFDMIRSGKKKFEYREIKDYWVKRLCGSVFNDGELPLRNVTLIMPYGVDRIRFKNGYNSDSPQFVIEWKELRIGYPIAGLCPPDTDLNKKVFCLVLGDIIDYCNT